MPKLYSLQGNALRYILIVYINTIHLNLSRRIILMKTYYETEQGRISACADCSKYSIEFGNLSICMDSKELSDFYTMVRNTDFQMTQESEGLKDVYYRFKGADLTLGFDQAEVLELHTLLEFGTFFIDQSSNIEAAEEQNK